MKPIRSVRHGAIKVNLPDSRQATDYTCGASCFETIAGYFGVLPFGCEESHIASVMGIASDCGAHPHNIVRGIRHYGLEHKPHCNMTVAQVKAYLDRGIPVMMMLQAWHTIDRRKKRWQGYQNEWNDGHWVAAIGYDRSVVYLEDPSLAVLRGWMTYEELEVRWHDVGPGWKRPYKRHMDHYGIAIWKAGSRKPAYPGRAGHID